MKSLTRSQLEVVVQTLAFIPHLGTLAEQTPKANMSQRFVVLEDSLIICKRFFFYVAEFWQI